MIGELKAWAQYCPHLVRLLEIENVSSVFLWIYILLLTSVYNSCNSFLSFVISVKFQVFFFFHFDFLPLPIVIPVLDVKYLEISIHLKELQGSLKNNFFSYAVYHIEHFSFYLPKLIAMIYATPVGRIRAALGNHSYLYKVLKEENLF